MGARLGVLVEQQAGLATTTTSGGLFGTSGRLAGAGARVSGAGQARAAAALPAAAAVRVQPEVLPLTKTDEFGAVSILESEAAGKFVPQTFENLDGRRIEDGRYAAFAKELEGEGLASLVASTVLGFGRWGQPSCSPARR